MLASYERHEFATNRCLNPFPVDSWLVRQHSVHFEEILQLPESERLGFASYLIMHALANTKI